MLTVVRRERPRLVDSKLKEEYLRETEISESRKTTNCVKKLSYVIFSISVLTVVQPLEEKRFKIAKR